MNPPLVTVGMVTYNSEKFVRIAIDSVLGQTYENFELIIGDDNSTDKTWEIINTYRDGRIKTYRNELNIGEYPNRKKILSGAVGKYFIFIDGDDIIYPHGLEHMVKYLEAFPDSAMALSQTPKKGIIYPCELTPRQTILYDFLSYNYINHHGFPYTFFKTEVLQEFWDIPPFIMAGDTYLKIRISSEYNVLLIPDGLAWWRETPGQASKNLQNNMIGKTEALFCTSIMLNNTKCPLSEPEKEQVRINSRGGFLREVVFNYLLKGKVVSAFKIIRKAGINLNDIKYFFKKPKYKLIQDEEIINPLTDFYKNPFLKNSGTM
jgi:glycosyltransferase involved in cell wall biosynthesis